MRSGKCEMKDDENKKNEHREGERERELGKLLHVRMALETNAKCRTKECKTNFSILICNTYDLFMIL